MTKTDKESGRRGRTIAIQKCIFVFAAACLLSPGRASAQSCSGVAGSTVGAVTWTPQWCEEFNGPLGTPNTATWNFELGNNNGWGNHELEIYCGPPGYPNNPAQCSTSSDPTTSNAYVDGNGHLVIQAFKINSNPAAVGSWTSTRMNTSTSPIPTTFNYGRIEAREKLPVGSGLWPAFWALGGNIATVSWPACGEIDFMENVPASGGLGPTQIASTLHGGNSSTNCYCGANGLSKKYTFPNGSDVTSFHVYGAIWSPNMIQFYVDDPANVFSIRTASDVPAGLQWDFNHAFFVLTNLAVGGGFPGPPDTNTPSPAQMMVDYVRYYAPSAVTPPNLGNPAAIAVKAGATTGNTSTINLTGTSGSGRVYLACVLSSTIVKAGCRINTGNALNQNVADFTNSSTATATVTMNTTANSLMTPVLFAPRVRTGLPVALAALMLILLVAAFVVPRARVLRATSKRIRLVGLVLASAIIIIASCGGAGGYNSASAPVPSGGTTPGIYTVTVNAYTVSGNGTIPDATVTFNLTVN
ncbi:MAG: glycoside hydrolase family 16 protein [Terriglobia bacterium]